MKNVIAVILLGICLNILSAPADEFFNKGSQSADIKLPADGIFPRGQKMGIYFYSVGGGSEEKLNALLPPEIRKADQEAILTSGAITMLGQNYELNDGLFELSKQYNLPLAYPVEPVVTGERVISMKQIDKWAKDKRPFPEKELVEATRKAVKEAMANAKIVWWLVFPSELRFWRAYEVKYLEVVTRTIRETDPEKRPIFMYEPGHRDAEAMSKMGQYTDLIGKGMYVNYGGKEKERVYCRWTMEQVKGALKLLNRDENMALTLPEMFKQPQPEELPLIDTWVRHDVYCSLINGAKGLLIFSARRRPNFTARQTYLDAYYRVNRELIGPRQLSRPFLFGAPMNDLTMKQLSGPEKVTLTLPKEVLEYPPVSFANLALDRERYIFLANSANDPVKIEIDGLPADGVVVADLFDANRKVTPAGSKLVIDIPALGVIGYKLSRR